MRPFVIALVIVGLGACAGPSSAPKSQPEFTPMAGGGGDTDVVRLKSGETIKGKIVRMDESNVAIETDQRVRVFARRDVLETSFASNPKDQQKMTVDSRKDDARTPPPPSSWYPRTSTQEPVTQAEISFYEVHPPVACLGQLAKAFEDTPELVLFAEPGGKIVLHDPRRWGFHAHVGEVVERPVDKPGLSLVMPKKLPSSIAFVSPAQEMKTVETPPRTSYAIPDGFYAQIKELAAADVTLAAQPFAGGKAKETADGTLWAFSTPRNDRQCWVYLFDREKRHGKVLEQSFATYGDAILAPDLMLDMVTADGVIVGRVLLLPIPDGLSADGPAPEPITIRVGKDAAVETTVGVPPRQAIVLPPKAPSTRADVHVNFYEISKGISEKILIAWGTGRPDKDVTLKSRDLTQETSDEHVRIDLSALSEDRFPAVAWLYHRRSFVWRSGGYRAPAAMLAAPGAPREKKPTKVISNQGRLAHALPILFVGPNPAAKSNKDLLDSPVVGGMSNAVMSDALARELGMMAAGTTLGAISSNATGGKNGGGGGGGDSATNITNLYIVIPPHTSGLPGDGVTTQWVPQTGDPVNWHPWGMGMGPDLTAGSPGNYSSRPTSWNLPSGYQPPKQPATYDPSTGAMTSSGSSNSGAFGYDPINNTTTWNVIPIRRNKP